MTEEENASDVSTNGVEPDAEAGEEGAAAAGSAGADDAEKSASAEDRSAADAEPSDRDPSDHDLEEAAEAIIFAADEPVEPHRIAEIVAEVTGRAQPSIDEVEAVVERLNEEYRETGRSIEIHRWAGGFQMATRQTLSPFVKALFVGEQETSLSRSLMETLAVLAYRQPVTRPEVDFVRGVNSDYAIRKLMEMGLADVKGRADSLGRPLLYGTTPRFLEQFGLNSLEDLPTLREVQELLDDPAFDEERAKLLQLDAEEAAQARQASEGGAPVEALDEVLDDDLDEGEQTDD
jgi:segregation and condensation protein B